MIVIYYRDKDGKIQHYGRLEKEVTKEQLAAKLEEYNSMGGMQACAQEIHEGSLEMHLFEMAQYRKRYPIEIIRAALDAIDEAREAIESMDVGL